MSLYKIKSLEWKEVRADWWAVTTIFNTFNVEKLDNGRWQWSYCIDEYYDEGSHECDSAEEAKRAAEAFYLDRLMPALDSADQC